MRINTKTLEKRREIAERIASRAKIERIWFSEHNDGWTKDMATALAESRLGNGKRFAVWLPVAIDMYRDESLRHCIEDRMRQVFPVQLVIHLAPPVFGPVNKLPA